MTDRDRLPVGVFQYDSREGHPFDFLDLDPALISRPERTLIYRAHLYLTGSPTAFNHADIQEAGRRTCADLDKLVLLDNDDLTAVINEEVLQIAEGLDDEIIALQMAGESDKVIQLITSRFTAELEEDATELSSEEQQFINAVCRQGIFTHIQKAFKSQFRISYSTV